MLIYSVVATFFPSVPLQGTVNALRGSCAAVITLILLGRFFGSQRKSVERSAIQHLVERTQSCQNTAQ
ncbi:hypothetical protein [Acinetobacter seifertii]|uniref:hypothetical protein n=1 Tax=Acinetobacter seifertii TaxID=1530123 RepID=UPI003F722B5A